MESVLNFFTDGKCVKFATKQCITLPTTPKICSLPHYLEKLWHWNYVIADVTTMFVNMDFGDEDKILIKKSCIS